MPRGLPHTRRHTYVQTTLGDTEVTLSMQSLETNVLGCSFPFPQAFNVHFHPNHVTGTFLSLYGLKSFGVCFLTSGSSHLQGGLSQPSTGALARGRLQWSFLPLPGWAVCAVPGREGPGGQSLTRRQYRAGTTAHAEACPLQPTDPRKGCAHTSAPRGVGVARLPRSSSVSQSVLCVSDAKVHLVGLLLGFSVPLRH